MKLSLCILLNAHAKSILLILVTSIFFSKTNAQEHFLENHVGEYRGYLKLVSDKNTDSIPFGISITRTDNPTVYGNKTSYFINDSTTIVKAYYLKIDSLKKYVLDEENGIFISEKLIGNTFYSAYNVEKRMYTVRTSYLKNKIAFELCVYSEEKAITTLSEPDEHGDRFEVKDYPFVTIQYGMLSKIKSKKNRNRKK
jgi:hypothetical protein